MNLAMFDSSFSHFPLIFELISFTPNKAESRLKFLRRWEGAVSLILNHETFLMNYGIISRRSGSKPWKSKLPGSTEMVETRLHDMLHQVRFLACSHASVGDEDLLARFLQSQDEWAFEMIVRRHGPVVWGVCHRVLNHHADAEDAFQATFLVLVRKAGKIARPEGLGNWLYGVAYHTAQKARAMNLKRRMKESKSSAPISHEPPSDEILQLLDRELQAVPEKFRSPIVLCDLQGRSLKEAAQELGCPLGTVASRLARGRRLLADRLKAHGVSLSVAGMVSLMETETLLAICPEHLMGSTAQAASHFAAGHAGAVPATTAALVEGVLSSMAQTQMTKLSLFVGTLVLLAFLGYGAAASDQDPKKLEGKTPPKTQVSQAKMQAIEILREAVEAVEKIEDAQHRAWRFQGIAERLASLGDRSLAAKISQKAVDASKLIRDDNNPADPFAQSWHTMVWIADMQTRIGLVDAGKELAKSIEPQDPRCQAHSLIAGTLAKNGDVTSAKTVFNLITTERHRDLAAAAISKALVDTNKLDEARAVIETMAEEPGKVAAYGDLAVGYWKQGRRENMEKVLSQAKTLAFSVEFKERTGQERSVALSWLADAHVAMGSFEHAKLAVSEIQEAPWKENALARIAVAQAEQGKIADAEKTLEAVSAPYIQGDAQGKIAWILMSKQDFKSAERVRNGIENVFGQVLAYRDLTFVLAKAGDLAGAKAAAGKAAVLVGNDGEKIEDTAEGIGGLRLAGLSAFAEARAAAGEVAEALAWARRQEPGRRVDLLRGIANGLLRTSN